jgi:acyl-CoA thioester hydrolase
MPTRDADGGAAVVSQLQELPVSQPFEEQFSVRWSDLDANRHVRNTIFSELATHSRFRFLESRGFPQAKFEALRFGPVMFREEIRYRRELTFGETVTVDVQCAGLSEDGSYWRVQQQVRRPDGKQAAVLVIDGAWIHLDTRKVIVPPDEVAEVLNTLSRTGDFELLKSVVRRSVR